MKKVCFALIAATVLIGASAASAQAIRTWVSGVGNDSNPCSRTAPCQTFAGALSKTLAGGEISALDPGGFGAVTITKAITISGDGTLASILASNSTGVTINAGVNDKVVLRNLSINGVGNGLSGISYIAGKHVTVENCSIAGFTNHGIEVALANNGTITVKDTNISNTGAGIRAATTVGLARVWLDNVNIESSTNGIDGGANSRIYVSNSAISDNTSNGVLTSSATTRIFLSTCRVSFNNAAGINAANAGSIIRLSDNDIYSNISGITFVAGATIESANNNRVHANNATTPPNAVMTIH